MFSRTIEDLSGKLKLLETEKKRLMKEGEGSNVSGEELLIQETEFSPVKDSEYLMSRQTNTIGSGFIVDELERTVAEKTFFSDFFMLELQQQKEFNIPYVKAASDATEELKRLLADMELMERVKSEKEIHIKSKEREIKRLEDELRTAGEESKHWRSRFKIAQEVKHELSKRLRHDSKREDEIASFKLELQKCKSTLSAVEASHARALSAQAGMFLAVQQLAQELETAKKEEKEDPSSTSITISVETYTTLIEKAKKADEISKNTKKDDRKRAIIEIEGEFVSLRESLAIANERIHKLQFGLDEALRRVAIAERARLDAEEKISNLIERKPQSSSDSIRLNGK